MSFGASFFNGKIEADIFGGENIDLRTRIKGRFKEFWRQARLKTSEFCH